MKSETNFPDPRLRDFSFSGNSFACSAVGVLACCGYCITWGLVNPATGVTCDVACGLAFAAACSTVS